MYIIRQSGKGNPTTENIRYNHMKFIAFELQMAHANLRLQDVKKFQRCLIDTLSNSPPELAYNLTKKATLRFGPIIIFK